MSSPTRSFAGGVARALALIAVFPAAGLAVRAGLQAGSAPPLYPASWMEEIEAEDPELWLVDGFNVVQVALLSGRDRDAWWRAERRDELMAHATQKKYEYRHKWRYGDMVIWDNRSVLHQANGDYDMNETRYLYRIMVKGEPVLAAEPEAVAA